MKHKITFSITLLLAGTAIVAAKPNGDRQGPPSHAEFMEQFDTDGDGTLSETEREAAKQAKKGENRRQGGGNDEMRQKMLERFDADGDGKLTSDERQQAREAMQQKRMLRRFDRDGDGQLNATEQAEAEAFRAEREAQILEQFDADGDGILSDEERQAARKDMRKGGPKGPKPPRGDKEGRGPPPPPGGEDGLDT